MAAAEPVSEQKDGDKDASLIMTVKAKPPLNLVLCGRRGAVKTSAAKVILGQTELHLASNSSECVRNQGQVCGRWVSLVELPALYGEAQQKVMEESFRCISLCDPEGVHAFILVLPVGPLTDEDKGELQTFQDTFSSRVNDFTMVLFTVESDPAAPAVVNFVKENKDIQELCQSCGGRYVVVNIKDQQQIPELMEKVETLIGQKPKLYSNDMFTRVLIERTLKVEAELQDVKQMSEMRGEDELRKEIEEVKEKEEEQKKKQREDIKALRSQLEQERKLKVQLQKEKDESMKKELEKRKKEREEEERKWKKQEEWQRKEWKQKLDASEKRVHAELEQREATEKKLDQCRRERNRERDAWDKEKVNFLERLHQDLKRDLQETKKNLEEERTSHRKLQEEFYQKRRKWTYLGFTLLMFVSLVLLYVYQSR
ncbi:golgin subfamily A member 6-like protein 2 isoform X2 [Girardinichthys multiradiatus]|uniref:golgin subfamily A member 6-like protein 2 isoform X2 n=1 Tax=Girardinichthys multiradiatus TaxID=208333 RepID=UPI001FAC5CE9|nr:golgin subfamily A member 6-like protein 2 isoform X2 [Girardinichthys multiradiatus]